MCHCDIELLFFENIGRVSKYNYGKESFYIMIEHVLDLISGHCIFIVTHNPQILKLFTLNVTIF